MEQHEILAAIPAGNMLLFKPPGWLVEEFNDFYKGNGDTVTVWVSAPDNYGVVRHEGPLGVTDDADTMNIGGTIVDIDAIIAVSMAAR